MFQLYKKRDFSEYLNDTFGFLKITGKHFFKNFFIICGGFLIALCALSYFVCQWYMSFVFSLAQGGNSNPFLGENLGLYAIILILFLVLAIILGVLSYLYPLVYLKLYETKGSSDFTTQEIIQKMKENLGRSLKYSLIITLLSLTIGIFVVLLLIAICITIIGIPFAVIAFFAIIPILTITYYEYIHNREVRFMDALNNAYQYVKRNLWPIVGANFVIAIVVQIVISVISMIPYTIMIGNMLTSTNPSENLNQMASMSVAFSILMVVSYLLTFILQNLGLILNGLIYYSKKESEGNHHVKSEIDLIGLKSE